jgi:type I restriction enzyme S subunit
LAVAKTIKNNVEMSWEKLKISDFTSVITGGTPSTTKTEYWENGHIPWLNSGALNQEIITESENFITQAGLENSSTRMMPKDTILIALTGTTTGVVGYLSFEACANQSVTGILPSNKHHPKFLYYYLKSIREQILEASYGGAQKHISQAFVKELLIPLPPLATQKRIADILDTADALRRKDQELLTKYDQLAQAIFIDMFGDPVKNEKGWEVKKLGEVTLKIGSGSTPTGGKTAYKEKGISLIRSMNVYDFAFKYKDLAYIDDIQAKKLNNVEVKSMDILFNITGASVCRCSIVPDKILPARVNQHVSIIRVKDDVLNPIFLNHLLVSNQVKNNLLGIGAGGGAVMEAITKDQLENFEIIIPDFKRQNEFAQKIKLLDAQKTIQSNSHSTSLFSSLIQQAFNGILVS